MRNSKISIIAFMFSVGNFLIVQRELGSVDQFACLADHDRSLLSAEEKRPRNRSYQPFK